MKIRTKLVLLLCGALIFTTVASTLLQVRLTREALEQHERDQATETAEAIAQDLKQHITVDSDEDDISDRFKFLERSHRSAVYLELDTGGSDEDTTISYTLDFKAEEPKIKRIARPRKPMRPGVRREEILRALDDRGQLDYPPGERAVGPLWRTPDRAESSRWATLASRAHSRRPPRAVVVDLREKVQRQDQRYVEVSVPVELEGRGRCQLTMRSALDSIDRLARIEQVVSAGVTGTALLLLIVLSALIADRVVGRPVGELEQAMRGVEGGDLTRRVDVHGRDEIGKLGEGFNAMIARLSEADDEIRAFNRRLADEVRAATTDLARKNEALAHLNRLLVETQRELASKERLAVLGHLAAQLAHEIGTPLGSVSGHLQLAISSQGLPVPVRERLLVATRELERVSRIVRDYLDSTRPVKPSLVSCDLERLIEEALGIARSAAERPGVVVEQRIGEDARRLQTDPGLLRQVLVNLLTNALDAVAPREGRDDGARIVVETAAGAGFVSIAVGDNGSGIGPEDRARIFEPFYTTKGRGKGTGLGLSICRELVQAMGGRITVESVPGRGSTFTVRLPAPAARRDEGPPPAEARAADEPDGAGGGNAINAAHSTNRGTATAGGAG